MSYVIISYNRRQTLLGTLARLSALTPMPADSWDIWVVDNASTDGSAEAVAANFPRVNLIRNARNEGMPARNRALALCRGEYVVLLDDDSYPADAAAVPRMATYLDLNPNVAAVTARAVLPDGTAEASALPGVFIGCAVMLRRAVPEQVGGFSREFFRQAEEYDLSFRIWGAGYRIERFEDIVFRHDKVAGAGRSSSLVCRMDMRNNLIVAERYLPPEARRIYMEDWRQRYGAIARHAGQGGAARRGRWEAWLRRRLGLIRRQTLGIDALESLLQTNAQEVRVGEWAAANRIRSVVIGDFCKNIYATYRACRQNGLRVVAIVDGNPAFSRLLYRRAPIVSPTCRLSGVDGIVLSNISPALVDRRIESLRQYFSGPILRLWKPRTMPIVAERAA